MPRSLRFSPETVPVKSCGLLATSGLGTFKSNAPEPECWNHEVVNPTPMWLASRTPAPTSNSAPRVESLVLQHAIGYRAAAWAEVQVGAEYVVPLGAHVS